MSLPELVWYWWLEHRYDTVGSWNVYDEPPEFVRVAGAMLSGERKKELELEHYENL